MVKLIIQNEDHWHQLRAKHIGGSEVAALFGRSPYTTPWQLWMEKAGKLKRPFDEKWTRAGKFFEAGIAAWAADKWGMVIGKVEEYYTDDTTPGMGATLDYATDDGIPVEIKFNHFRTSEWEYEGDVLTGAPESYIWQVQHQIACYGGDYGWLVAFLDGEPRRMKVKKSDRIIANIRKAVTDFWMSIGEDRPPPVDYKADGDALADLLHMQKVATVSLDPEMEAAVAQYRDMKRMEKECKEAADTFKAIILEAAERAMRGINDRGTKAEIKCGAFIVSLNEIAENPGKMVTADMVGTHVGGKKGHLRMTVKEAKDGK